MRWMRKLALLLALLPHAATTLACTCPDTGSPVELSADTASRAPRVELTNDATIECLERDREDHCNAYWIIPARVGTVTLTLHFSDGTQKSDTIEYGSDDAYPCRGSLRPVHDHLTRL